MPETGFVRIPCRWYGSLNVFELAVVGVLLCYADVDGRCWPSTRSLTQRLGISRSSVRKALAGLAERGVVTVTSRRSESGDADSNLYQVNFDWVSPDDSEGWVATQPTGGSPHNPPETGVGRVVAHRWVATQPTGGSPRGPELDPYELDPNEPDPHTPLTPQRGEACAESPSAEPEPSPEPPNRPVDGLAMRYQLHPWLDSRHRPIADFVEFVIRALPKKDDRAESLATARAYIRKVDHVEGRLDAVLQLWEDFQQHLTEKAEAERRAKEDAEIEALLARRW